MAAKSSFTEQPDNPKVGLLPRAFHLSDYRLSAKVGGIEEIRTPYLSGANGALSQVSYDPSLPRVDEVL